MQPFAFSKSKVLALTHMRCRTTASLRAERYLRLLHAGALGELHRPALECAAVDRPRQDDMSGLIENGATELSPILLIRPLMSVSPD